MPDEERGIGAGEAGGLRKRKTRRRFDAISCWCAYSCLQITSCPAQDQFIRRVLDYPMALLMSAPSSENQDAEMLRTLQEAKIGFYVQLVRINELEEFSRT
jgi:hypothetical protein